MGRSSQPVDSASPRRVVILHCHYEPGGVTQVVQNHVACLKSLVASDAEQVKDAARVVLVSGERTSGLTKSTLAAVELWCVPGMDYDERAGGEPNLAIQRGQELFEHLQTRLHDAGLSYSDTVLHWHNHSLGKNAAAPIAIYLLAKAGWKLLLQIHDFAEDQRPENVRYLIGQVCPSDSAELDTTLYPVHQNVSYATLTAGDASALVRWGIAEDRVAAVPNSVRLPSRDGVELDSTSRRQVAMEKVSEAFGVAPETRWVLYPVRGIRRKNVGEFLLLCQLLPAPFVGAITLRPDTPLEARSYQRWHSVAKRFVANVTFDAAHHPQITYSDNLDACHCVLSTSVAEGFGMAFLEPWLAGRSVVARDLPGVTADFVSQGVQLPDLYSVIRIPGDPPWLKQAQQVWEALRLDAWSGIAPTFRPRMTGTLEEDEFEWIDFARLTPVAQANVIERVANDAEFRDQVRKENQSVLDSIINEGDETLIESNRAAISQTYSQVAQRQQLNGSYSRLLQSNADLGPRGEQDSPRMIDVIDSLHPFYPCRVEQEISALD